MILFFNIYRISSNHLIPFANDLLIGLFAAFSLNGSNENEYVMKGKLNFILYKLALFIKNIWITISMILFFPSAIMRSVFTLQEASLPFMAVILPRLTEILTQVAKNPSRPHFNHYLFETLSLAIK